MPHHSWISKIVIDVPAADHDRELAFWGDATGQPLHQSAKFPEYHGAGLPGQDLGLLVQRLDSGTARVHLDIHTDDLNAEVDRLERMGARRIRQVNVWWIMESPAGLTFCVIQDPGPFDEGTAQRWD